MIKKIKLKVTLAAIPVFLMLTGCASDGSKFRSYSKQKGQRAVVVNMGVQRAEYFSNKLGGGLGLIGAALEFAATKDKANTQKDEIEDALSSRDLVAEFGSDFQKQVSKCGVAVSQMVRVETPTKNEWIEKELENWWKSDEPSAAVMKARGEETLAFEVAVGAVVVTSKITGESLGADVRVKIFDLNNSKLIDKINVTNVFAESIELKSFSAEKDRRQSELIEATTKSFKELSTSLGKKLCEV
jgi:hypothetical protein